MFTGLLSIASIAFLEGVSSISTALQLGIPFVNAKSPWNNWQIYGLSEVEKNASRALQLDKAVTLLHHGYGEPPLYLAKINQLVGEIDEASLQNKQLLVMEMNRQIPRLGMRLASLVDLAETFRDYIQGLIHNDETEEKFSIGDELNRQVHALEDPILEFSLLKLQVQLGVTPCEQQAEILEKWAAQKRKIDDMEKRCVKSKPRKDLVKLEESSKANTNLM